jgi:hypothetical protein
MNFGPVRRRIGRLERHYQTDDEDSFTLEQFSRMYWKADREGFRRFVKREAPNLTMFLRQFEEEEAAAKLTHRCCSRVRGRGSRPRRA